MDVILLQNWTTLIAPSTGAVTVTQSEPSWLDLSSYRDAVAWLDVKHCSVAGINVSYQSSVTKEEGMFASMGLVTLAAGASTVVTPMLQELIVGTTSSAPLARWFRWSVNIPNASADVTFRLWLACNKPGRASMNRTAAMNRQ